MRQVFCRSLFLAATLCAAQLSVLGRGLTLGSVSGSRVTVPVTMTSDQPVEGFVLSVAFPPNKLAALDVRTAGVGAGVGAELVIPEILPGGFTLGVVVDFEEPFSGQTIPSGTQLLIAEADLEATFVLLCSDSENVPVTFRDGLNDPPLRNTLVVGGASITSDEGLVLADGRVTVIGTCGRFRVQSTRGLPGQTVLDVPVALDLQVPCEGYVISLQHESGVALDAIITQGTDADAVGIEFEVPKIYPTGGTVGVVFDFEPPYAGQMLPAGQNQTLAIFRYRHEPFTCTGSAQNDERTYRLTFKEGVFGTPPLSNIVVLQGFSVRVIGDDGSVTFACQPQGESRIRYFVGKDTGGEEPDIVCAPAAAGAEGEVTLYYASDTQPIQGLSMALCFPTTLKVLDLDPQGQGAVTARHLQETVTQAINAEFVSFNASNAKGELVVGILVDSTPPIPINHMYPPSEIPAKVLTIFFAVPVAAPCNTEYLLRFCEGITGAGQVPISNRAAVFNESIPAVTRDGCLRVAGKAAFLRGDCNTDQMVDIADPAATMAYLFLGVFRPACLDACDSNDDGVVDLADVNFTLRFLFKLGKSIPPPGPYPPGGVDPTPDIFGLDLGCEAGDPCRR